MKWSITILLLTTILHSSKANYNGGKGLGSAATSSLAGLHNSQDWLGYALARQIFSSNWPRARPGEYFECTRKNTKYIASKQADDKASPMLNKNVF